MIYLFKELTLADQDKILADIKKSNDHYMQKKVTRLFDIHKHQPDKTEHWIIEKSWSVDTENDSYLLDDPTKPLQFITKSVYCFYYKNMFYQLISKMNWTDGSFMVINTTKNITYQRATDIPIDLKTAISKAFHVWGKYTPTEFKSMSQEQINEILARPVVAIEFVDYPVAEYGYL